MQNTVITAVLAFVLGIALVGLEAISYHLSVLYTVAVVLLIGFIIALFKWIKAAQPLLVMLFIVAGMIHVSHVSQLPASDISHRAGQNLTVIGTVADIPQVSPYNEDKDRIKYTVAVHTVVTDQGKAIPVTGCISVGLYQSSNQPVINYGAEVGATGKISLPYSYGNPGMIDSSAALKRQGITARLAVADGQIWFSPPQSTWYWQTILAGWRNNIVLRMQQAMSQDTAAILAGTLFGGYTGIPKEVIKSFSITGIVHILSVSGTHIALVAGVIFWLGSLMRVRHSIVAFWAALAIVLYALISGCTSPVVRSAVMGIIGLAAVGLRREKDAVTALMVAGFAMLVYQPENLFDISFQLSFGATAGLIFLYPRTVDRLKSLPLWLAGPVAVTFAAQLSVLPFLAWYFKSFSLSSFFANLVIVPIIEVAVVLGLIASTLGAVFSPINLLWSVCSKLINVVVHMTQQLAAIPGASIYIPPMHFGAGVVYYLGLAWIYGYRPQFLPSPADFFAKWPKTSSISVILFAIALLGYSIYPRPFFVHFIDVGQGDATLIITPHRRAILIDSGGTVGQSDQFDVGERVVLPYLKHYGILNIDYLILTHGHQDHAGGAAAIVSGIPVRNILLAREASTPAIEKLTNRPSAGTFIPTYKNQKLGLDGATVTIVYDGLRQQTKSANESSTVIQVSYGKHSFLITGDLEAKGETEILTEKTPIVSTVLKIGHHGSKTSTTDEFLTAVEPEYAVISVGYNNRFGHPHADVLQRLAKRNIAVYRTDEQGALVFESDGENIRISPFRK
ncbi:ComE operon protein 3 [bioreactor metagenome]|uniref:ComE operon protein 3 n=1 Tax=bioreactor metagenome TaxID=1076179 RepID=A0A644T957_9ZZZZ|nr:DNA internalization-related competence protein ComEC/Rec2 [Negativicutes bacterium]